MKWILLILGLTTVASGQNVCGALRDTPVGTLEVHCLPNLRPFGTMFPDTARVQLWIRSDRPLTRLLFVRLRYTFGAIVLEQWRLVSGNGLIASSFDVPTLNPTQVDVWDALDWEWGAI